MPDWEILLGDITLLQAVLWIVAAALLVGLVIKLWPFVRNAVAIVDALVTLPATSKQVRDISTQMTDLTEKVDGIHHETHRNDGSSIKDAVGRVEEGVAGLHGRMDDVDRQLSSLAREDEALWAEIESTHNPESDDN